ncbi:MAG: ABC transporter permease [Chloroflexi bacterium]|nr:ABC transporter permease [Chloroflexota bacterium]
MFSLAIRELTRRKRQHILTVMVVALVTAMIIVLNSLGTAYKEASRLPFQDVQGTVIVQKNGNVPEDISGALVSCSLAPIGQGTVSAISGLTEVKDVSTALYLWVFDKDHFKRALGVNWDDNFGGKLRSKIVQGAIPNTLQEALLDKTYAEQNSLGIGQEADVAGRHYTVTGIVQGTGNEVVASDVYLYLREAQDIAYVSSNLQDAEPFARTDVNIVFVDTPQSSIGLVAQEITRVVGAEGIVSGQTPLGQTVGSYSVYTPESFDTQISSLLHLSDKLLWIISLVTFIGAIVIVARNMTHGIAERRKEFAIMKSVGFRQSDIQKEIFFEAALQVCAGFLVGLVLSAVVVGFLSHTTVSISIPWELNPYPHFLVANPEEASATQVHTLPIGIEPVYAGLSLLATATIALLSSYLSGWQVARLKSMEVMKYE